MMIGGFEELVDLVAGRAAAHDVRALDVQHTVGGVSGRDVPVLSYPFEYLCIYHCLHGHPGALVQLVWSATDLINVVFFLNIFHFAGSCACISRDHDCKKKSFQIRHVYRPVRTLISYRLYIKSFTSHWSSLLTTRFQGTVADGFEIIHDDVF